MKRLLLPLLAGFLAWGQTVPYTSTSSAYAAADGSLGIGVEVNFTGQGTADQTWSIQPISAFELEGTIAMRSEDKADVLVRIYLGSRLIVNENLKTASGRSGAKNIQVYIAPAALQSPASTIRVYIGAAAAGNGWPVDCEVEMSGRWQ